ncbi:hypothetical protein FO519_008793 [Halicephalobus sp. NKZ332]|nr:hypothetical protein FO519_008793 [Halicephalobus sp. NKZ332]
MSGRYDLVLYGVTGFTGAYVLEVFAKSSNFGKVKLAVAGRNESKIRSVLKEVSNFAKVDVTNLPIIIADSGNEKSLGEMAKQAKVIVNVVGPYRLYGEAVVKAAVENGASHVDISGEPAFLEKMQQKYGKQAKENGVYVVGACGWDSIPCDLGVNFLKQNFDGTLEYAETFVHVKNGPSGYSFNAGTYQTLILGIWQAKNDGLGKIRKEIMPQKLERSPFRPKKRGNLWWNETLECYSLPFPGSDRSVVQRSQYFDATENNARPVNIETYMLIKSKFWALALMLWVALLSVFVQFGFTRKLLQKYPDVCSFYMFKNEGPSRQQAKEASFTYWIFGKGWGNNEKAGEKAPEKTKVARCDGPDAGYIGTSGCVLASALTILQDKDKLPEEGGVFTTTAAFKETKIYDRLREFGVTFRVDDSVRANL